MSIYPEITHSESRRALIYYHELNPIVDEKLRRLIVVNSLLKSITPEERDLVLNRKAIILYRNDRFWVVGVKDELKSKD
jgi:hypothetical protein